MTVGLPRVTWPRAMPSIEGSFYPDRSLWTILVFKKSSERVFKVDPGHVRRKFYERVAACGLP